MRVAAMSASTTDGLRCSARSNASPGPPTSRHLPSNDLASSPLAPELRDLGAIRADATGAGPVAYGVFPDRDAAERAAAALGHRASTWVATPA